MPAPADVDWEAARRLWEGTDLSQGEIADQFGVARTTVAGAARRFGWGPRPPRGAGRPAVAKKPTPAPAPFAPRIPIVPINLPASAAVSRPKCDAVLRAARARHGLENARAVIFTVER